MTGTSGLVTESFALSDRQDALALEAANAHELLCSLDAPAIAVSKRFPFALRPILNGTVNGLTKMMM
jgi:hypothetical protein